MTICFIILFLSLANYLIITTIVDCVLMGKLHFQFSIKCREKEFVSCGERCSHKKIEIEEDMT